MKARCSCCGAFELESQGAQSGVCDACKRHNTREALDQEAYQLSQRLDSAIRFSPEWTAIVAEVQAWTAKHGRSLYATYND